MQDLGGLPAIGFLLARLARATSLDEIVVATPEHAKNDSLVAYVQELGYPVYRGSAEDVLDRYYHAALSQRAEVVIRVTGDCPLIDPGLVDLLFSRFTEAGVDYATNSTPATYPDGVNVEICTFEALERAWRESTRRYDREHVTPFLRDSGLFNWINVPAEADYSLQRWTVDEPEDLQVVKAVVDHYHPWTEFTWRDVLELSRTRPEMFEANRHLVRDEGSMIGNGEKLWKRARRILPGGSMLLSKRAEMFLPGRWPAYFSRAKGCSVWDLDGREFIDAGYMGIGTNTLGYGHPEVDSAVLETVAAGNLSTLNCPEEVFLAERLVAMHPWSDMVRFARSGGEINAVAIRIARAAAGRTKVAFCGYHGWHDWYLAANLGDESRLAGHLLPGLEPNGVPQQLKGTALPFTFNNFAELEAIAADPEVGVICMEVMRNVEPSPGFLEQVRALATAKGIVLMFDECTSGFRETFGGLHKKYGVEPDLATFGKTLGNGYAVTAVIGRRAVMEHAQSSFISSTFWTERIGSAAALRTLDVMEREQSWERITDIGQTVQARWLELAARHGLPLSTTGLPSMATYTIASPNAHAYKTLITQEMLKRGYLATTALYACLAHTPAVLDGYFEALDPVFGLIRQCQDGRSVDDLLEGPVSQVGFQRLN